MSEPLPEIFAAVDSEVAEAIVADKLHRGTALFVLNCFAAEARRNVAGLELVATHTEAAVKPQGGHGG